MRTLTVDEVDAVSGAHPLTFWAVAAYLGSKVTVTKVAFGAGAVVGFGVVLEVLRD